MKNFHNEPDRNVVMNRLQKLSSNAEKKWGKFTVHQMVVHVSDQVRHALGDKQSSISGKFHHKTLMKWMVLWLPMPWPKGAAGPKEMLPGTGMTEPEEFEGDKQKLILLLHRLSKAAASQNGSPHPLFGKMSRHEWGRITWLHLDHHLRQFSN